MKLRKMMVVEMTLHFDLLLLKDDRYYHHCWMEHRERKRLWLTKSCEDCLAVADDDELKMMCY